MILALVALAAAWVILFGIDARFSILGIKFTFCIKGLL